MSMEAHSNAGDVVQEMPVNRDYDFEEMILEDVPEYKAHNGELNRIMSDIHNASRLPRFLIGGPTGCGKTHLARYISQELPYYIAEVADGANKVWYFGDIIDNGLAVTDGDGDPVYDDDGFLELEDNVCPETGETLERRRGCPIITIQCKYSMSEADLLGMPNLAGDETFWQDGPLPKAIQASREGPVVLLLDEANRARPESKSALFSALDDRAEVTLDGRGGERISGVARNLISIATINEGAGYYVENMDLAEKRRLGIKFDVDYLGASHPEKEIELMTERTAVHEGLAEDMVEAANTVRKNLAEDDASPVKTGIPTGTLLAWGETAHAYYRDDINNPVMEAAKDTVIRPFYGGEDGESAVREAIASHMDDVPFDKDEYDDFTEDLNDQTSGSSPDNAQAAQQAGQVSSNADVDDVMMQLEQGVDPHDLLKQGVPEETLMKAMTKASASNGGI